MGNEKKAVEPFECEGYIAVSPDGEPASELQFEAGDAFAECVEDFAQEHDGVGVKMPSMPRHEDSAAYDDHMGKMYAKLDALGFRIVRVKVVEIPDTENDAEG